MNQLKKEKDINTYIAEHENSFVKKPLVQFLNELLNRYKIKKADVINKSGMATVYGYQIFDGRRKPKRDKVIQIAIGFKLSLEDTQKLLRNAGYNELYPKNRRDVIFIYAINNKLNITEMDNLLYEMGEARAGNL
jgi:hypothetical protein